jgi:hypothetical protein
LPRVGRFSWGNGPCSSKNNPCSSNNGLCCPRQVRVRLQSPRLGLLSILYRSLSPSRLIGQHAVLDSGLALRIVPFPFPLPFDRPTWHPRSCVGFGLFGSMSKHLTYTNCLSFCIELPV